MSRTFSDTLSSLRKEKNISQRQAAAELGISQALLSHYETGSREPGLKFVCKACDYYGVTADYLLGRTDLYGREGSLTARDCLSLMREVLDRAETALDNMDGERI